MSMFYYIYNCTLTQREGSKKCGQDFLLRMYKKNVLSILYIKAYFRVCVWNMMLHSYTSTELYSYRLQIIHTYHYYDARVRNNYYICFLYFKNFKRITW